MSLTRGERNRWGKKDMSYSGLGVGFWRERRKTAPVRLFTEHEPGSNYTPAIYTSPLWLFTLLFFVVVFFTSVLTLATRAHVTNIKIQNTFMRLPGPQHQYNPLFCSVVTIPSPLSLLKPQQGNHSIGDNSGPRGKGTEVPTRSLALGSLSTTQMLKILSASFSQLELSQT